jgi:hypothetical protein
MQALRCVRDDVEKEQAFLGLCRLVRANPEAALASWPSLAAAICSWRQIRCGAAGAPQAPGSASPRPSVAQHLPPACSPARLLTCPPAHLPACRPTPKPPYPHPPRRCEGLANEVAQILHLFRESLSEGGRWQQMLAALEPAVRSKLLSTYRL